MNTFLGIVLHAIGGFCAASFYIPIKKIKKWSWETYWLVQGIGSWLIAPSLLAYLTVPNGELGYILSSSVSQHGTNVFLAVFFGMLWGIGGLSFGLSMRYLGVSLGQSVALGFCAAFGTMIPPMFHGTLLDLFTTISGITTVIGVGVTLAGIATVGFAGTLKEKNLTDEQKRYAIKEFALKKGLLIATFSGIMSSCMAFAIDAASPIREIATSVGTAPIFSNNPSYIFIMFGGLVSNGTWCLILNYRNKTFSDYRLSFPGFVKNLSFAWLGGFTWYFQFFFYGMGERNLGDEYSFASWSIHMAFIIAFSNIWGLVLKEWKSANKKIMTYLILGIAILILSTFVIGFGAYLGGSSGGH
jgi:L-rhamnose-H+ transport protein